MSPSIAAENSLSARSHVPPKGRASVCVWVYPDVRTRMTRLQTALKERGLQPNWSRVVTEALEEYLDRAEHEFLLRRA